MARSDLYQTRLLGFAPLNIDAVTTLMLGLLDKHSTVRHISCATDEILSCLDDAGLQLDEDMHRYETGEEAEAFADDLIAKGKRLFWPYPLREGRFGDDAHLVSPALYAELNSKENLPALAPGDALAARHILSVAALDDSLAQRPAYLKAAGLAATGWGYAVRYVDSDADIAAARADFEAQGVNRVLVEEAVDVVTCWCASLGVVDSGATYLGAAEQTFSAPAKQSGSVIDPGRGLPDEGIALAATIAEAARRKGFRGICGFDIGLSRDGGLYVFDPNFRFNSSTPQAMLHAAAAQRSGLGVSFSFSERSTNPMTETIARLKGPISDGWFVPTRLLDHALLPAAEGASLITGFVLGQTQDAATRRAAELKELIA